MLSAQLSARSGAPVRGRPLPTSLRRRFSAASQVRQSTTTGSSATPVGSKRTAFSVAGPSAWKSLPGNLRDPSTQGQLP